MRRPTFCQNSVGAVDTQAPPRPTDKEESRLSRVKRIFGGSLLAGRRPSPVKSFGVCLEELPLTNEGVPRVLIRIITFIEVYGLQIEGLFRLSGGNPKLVERLKSSFDRTGDADLEGCGDITSVASLLKIWLRDLPVPVVSASITSELVSLLHKYEGDPEWCVEARGVLSALDDRSAKVLQSVVRLLHRYYLRHPQAHNGGILQTLGCVFSPLLLCGDATLPGIATPDTSTATASLIAEYPTIYRERLTDHILIGPSQNSPDFHLYPPGAKKTITVITEPQNSGKKHRKRKDRQGDLVTADRKFVRSNSEERPCKAGSLDLACDSGNEASTKKKDSIRRVSSHEDFSRSRASKHSKRLMELISETRTSTSVAQPLQERNSSVVLLRGGSGGSYKLRNSNNNHNNNNNNNNSSGNKNVIGNNASDNINMGVGNDEIRIDSALKHVLEIEIASPVPDNALQLPQSTVGYASELFDENEHERRRMSERFAPQMGMGVVSRRRKAERRRRRQHTSSSQTEDQDGGNSSSKENEGDSLERDRNLRLQASFSGEESSAGSDTPGTLSRSSSTSRSSSPSPSFLQLHSPQHQLEERERSPSPNGANMSPERGSVAAPPSPALDLSTLHEAVDSSEPLPSDWSFSHRQPQERMQVSPRSEAMFAVTRRIFTPPEGDQNSHHPMVPPIPAMALPSTRRSQGSVEHHIAELTKQIQSVKKRLKRYEEGFEREFGYRPSHADKMANPDTKKMCSLLAKLRKDLKLLKTEGTTAAVPRLLHLPCAEKSLSTVEQTDTTMVSSPTKVIKEDVVHDVEKRLMEKRLSSGRPEDLDGMTREQLVEEKASVQRALLQLEGSYGRPSSKEERDLVRPLYDRYRSLKRLLVRSAASKLKDSVSELGTILEHEQMDFSSSSPPPSDVSQPLEGPSVSSAVLCPPSESQLRPTTPDLFENLHALPRDELLLQQRATREEKKKLRRHLKEFEEEFRSRTGRKLQKEDRVPQEATYADYKHVKAKLRLLEALLAKK